MENEEKPDLMLNAFKKLVLHMRGSLWWVRNDLLKERQPQFNPRDTHIGHPALSVLNSPLQTRQDVVPMLTGTSGGSLSSTAKKNCVVITGMTREDPTHKTYFGSIVEPAFYDVQTVLDAVSGKNEVYEEKGILLKAPWHEHRTMNPNWDKPMVGERELAELNRYCERHHL